MNKIDKRKRFQIAVLAVMAGMIFLFAILTTAAHTQKGVRFEGALLQVTEYEGQTVYSGTVDGTRVTITVAKTPEDPLMTTVEFSIGTGIYDNFKVYYPLEPISTDTDATADGIRIIKNGELLFEGGYVREEYPGMLGLGWYDADGAWTGSDFSFRVGTNTDPWHTYEIGRNIVMEFVLGPELVSRSSWEGYRFMVLVTLLSMLVVCFGRQLYILRQSWYVQDPEPTEFYDLTEKVGWVLLCIGLLVGYLFCLAEL